MKRTSICIIGLLCLVGLQALAAGPIPTSNLGRESVLSVPDLHAWSCGFYGNANDRGINKATVNKLKKKFGTSDEVAESIEWNRVMGYVGYDLVPWLTTYLTIGSVDYEIGENYKPDNTLQYGIGMNVNLIDKDVLDPTLMEDKLRVTFGLQYVVGHPEWESDWNDTGSVEVEVSEVSMSLIGSIVNDLEGSKLFLPNSIALLAGILYSDLRSDSENIDEEDSIGYTVGLEVFYTESVSLFGALESFDQDGYTAGINIRF